VLLVRFPSDIAPKKKFPQAPGLQPPARERKTDGETSPRKPAGKAKLKEFTRRVASRRIQLGDAGTHQVIVGYAWKRRWLAASKVALG
jgi:hypothetical protein